jgi:hypothetical protein
LLLYASPTASKDSKVPDAINTAAVPSIPLGNLPGPAAVTDQQQQQQQQLVQGLFAAVDEHFSSDHDLSWGLGSVAPLAVLDVDWGLNCLKQKLDWCNGKILSRC